MPEVHRMPVTVIDYLLVTTDGTVADTDTVSPAGAEGHVPLGNGVHLEAVDGELAQRLLLACEFRGERWDPPRQFGVAQAFVRTVDQTDVQQRHLYAWDQDQMVFTAVALSRFVRPHAIACDYAIRRIIDDHGEERLVPHDAAEARVAYRIEDGSCGWLDAGEAQQLQALLAAYQPGHLPTRVARALWLCELMVRERYLEDALPLIVAGLEALLKVGRNHLTAQFSQRTAGLAADLSIPLTETIAQDAYNDRSGIVHGALVDLTQLAERNRFINNVDLLQQTLRAAVRNAIQDGAFRALFASDATILGQWPVQDPLSAG
jgi:hypothetical protein